jgi:hypothetical protein
MWWQLKHDPDKIDKSGDAPWELSDSPQDPEGKESSELPLYYDGWVWGIDVQAETFEDAVKRAKELEDKFFRKL